MPILYIVLTVKIYGNTFVIIISFKLGRYVFFLVPLEANVYAKMQYTYYLIMYTIKYTLNGSRMAVHKFFVFQKQTKTIIF